MSKKQESKLNRMSRELEGKKIFEPGDIAKTYQKGSSLKVDPVLKQNSIELPGVITPTLRNSNPPNPIEMTAIVSTDEEK